MSAQNNRQRPQNSPQESLGFQEQGRRGEILRREIPPEKNNSAFQWSPQIGRGCLSGYADRKPKAPEGRSFLSSKWRRRQGWRMQFPWQRGCPQPGNFRTGLSGGGRCTEQPQRAAFRLPERKLCAHPRLEIYQQDQIYFMCPLARQGDFYVPEVKETERKFRVPAEANDAQVDGTGTDTMSDTSSVSLEVGPGSRETSAATLSPGVSSRGWDDGDTRSEHSYSESGASGSSFEELDLEGEGPLGEPRVGPEAEPLGVAKWPREPSTPEKGEE
ncbi:testis-expressed protein 264 isoform X2 [Physeter macrocephalus]|uniref:Testis-expressed protein 264 isoform X2 n=1 Tax=Physeter macrocephalus TaxID=9755 RepID=A0A455AGD2_PHYMC|nr:testis-expressed protein 264 isoform X2 [Physeter catodon]|eukprot:XP_028334549.1 testis-expressed protein 264 isoform X2 [Physeter catodon]